MKNYIKPNWPAPKNVKAYSTKRTGGVSQPPYDSFNFSLLTGDNPNDVLANRKILSQELNLPQEPFWLKQIHSDIVLSLGKNTSPDGTTHTVSAKNHIPILDMTADTADAAFTTDTGVVCAVLTADCVPILVCDENGTIVAAIHAGWKGIATGVIAATIKAMNINPSKLLAWLGPAIRPNAYAVKHDVYEIFLKQNPENKSAFVRHDDRFLANTYSLASLYLNHAGVTKVYGGKYCTYTQKDLFFSFRRDGEKTGRMANLIWLEKNYIVEPSLRDFGASEPVNGNCIAPKTKQPSNDFE